MFTDAYMATSPDLKEKLDRGMNINDAIAEMKLQTMVVEFEAHVVEAIRAQLPNGPFIARISNEKQPTRELLVHFIDKMATCSGWVIGAEWVDVIN